MTAVSTVVPVQRQVGAGQTRVLDALRGLAAFEVAGGHARWLLWAGFAATGVQHLRTLDAFTLAVYFTSVLRYGHQAVMVFFLISGFAIHYREAARLANGSSNGKIDLADFARRRMRRLFPPLLVAIVLTLALDALGREVNPSFYAGSTAYPLINANIGASASYTLLTIVGALLFQSSLLVPHLGTNGPLWSLSFEFWFYVAYPGFVYLSWRLGGQRALVVSALISLLAIALALFNGFPLLGVASDWVVWCSGAFLAEVARGRISLSLSPGFSLIAGMAIIFGAAVSDVVFSATVQRLGTISDWIWATGFWFFLYGILYEGYSTRLSGLVERAVQGCGRLGDISYTLYVIHFPILALASAIWLATHPLLPESMLLAAAVLTLILALSAVIARYIERPFKSRRATLDAKTSRQVA